MGEGMITRSVAGSGRGADHDDAASQFGSGSSCHAPTIHDAGGSAEALTWGATFAEAMVVIVNAALTRVCAFACGDNGAGTVQRAPSAGFVTLVSQLPDKSIWVGNISCLQTVNDNWHSAVGNYP